MLKKQQIINIVIIAIVLIGGFLAWQQFSKPANKTPEVVDLEPLRQSIISAPVVGEVNLTEELIDQNLSQYEEVLEKIIAVDFDTLDGLNQIAQIKRRLGDFDGAVAAWQYANAIRPENSLSFSNLAALYHYDLHEFEKADEQYQISIANDLDDLPTIRNYYELLFYDFKDNKRTEDLLIKSIANNPDVSDLYSLTGRFYADIGEIEKAIDYFEQHLERTPENEAAVKEVERLKNLL